MDFIGRQNQCRSQVEEKLRREAYEQQMYEQEVARMEKEELDLIMRLKNTKMLEEQAHHELESALTDPNPDQKLQSMNKERRGTAKGTRH